MATDPARRRHGDVTLNGGADAGNVRTFRFNLNQGATRHYHSKQAEIVNLPGFMAGQEVTMKYVMGIVAAAAILAMAGCRGATPSPDPVVPTPEPPVVPTPEPEPEPEHEIVESLTGEETIVGQWFCASSTAEVTLGNCTAFDGNMAVEIEPDGTGSQLEVFRRS